MISFGRDKSAKVLQISSASGCSEVVSRLFWEQEAVGSTPTSPIRKKFLINMTNTIISILFFAVGIAGAVLLIGAFYLAQVNRWKADDFAYDAANFFGSLLLVIYATWIMSWPFLILNTVWMIVSLFDMIRDIKRDHPKKNLEPGNKI